jgi:cytochrome c oxidase subunit III
MSGKVTHPYHLVNPSPWPILTAFALLGLTVGAALALHKQPYGLMLVFASLAATSACVFFWWRDVIREGIRDKAHTQQVSHGLRVGMALFITSEVMFFFAFFWAFFNASVFPKLPLEDVWAIAEGVWPPAGIYTFNPWDLPFLNTLILLLSGTTVTWAHFALLNNKRDDVITALWCTVGLGVSFSMLQAYEYSHAAFGLSDTVYGATFYMATGFHGLHVIIGTIFLAVMLRRAYTGTLTAEKHLGFEFAAWYWHFVDVVWLFLFVSIYWWGA